MSCDPIIDGGQPVGVICRPNKMERIVDRVDGDPRWCFKCRKKREFRYVVDREVGYSYYDPSPSVICGTCRTPDGDCFPGICRTWYED
jgi:hypothetical protein